MEKVAELISKLKEYKLTLGSVESMTGGSFASLVTSVSGSSSVFRGSLVTYASELKTKLANVSSSDITQYGVVSSSVAKQMSIGGAKTLECDVCISVTGNAGPSKCIGEAEVGDFYLGLSIKEYTISKFYHLEGDRNSIRSNAVNLMIDLILENLENNHA